MAGTQRLTLVTLSTSPQYSISFYLSRFFDYSYTEITLSSSSIFLTLWFLSIKDEFLLAVKNSYEALKYVTGRSRNSGIF